MSKMFKVGIVGLLIIGALTVVMAGTALAQEPTPPDPLDRPLGLGRGGLSTSILYRYGNSSLICVTR